MMKEEGDHGMTTISVRDDEMMDDVEILSEPYIPRHELFGPRRRLIALGIGLFVIVLIIIIAVSGSNKNNEEPSPYAAAPVDVQDKALYEEVKDALDLQNVTTNDMLLKDSYQYKAFTWLLEEDNDGYNRTQLLQRYALAAFYYSTNDVGHEFNEGPGPWKNATNWLTEDDECTWTGLECDDQGKIDSIVLKEKNLSGKIPLDLVLIRDPLRTLDVSDNEIFMDEEDFVLFEHVHKLTTLIISNNYMVSKDGPPTELKALTNLQVFQASNTMFMGLLENGVLETLTKLSKWKNNMNTYLACARCAFFFISCLLTLLYVMFYIQLI
jgi:hypothetical protein